MPDHYRTLVQSLMQMGFLFRRVTERKEEVWRNRLTDQEVTFDRKEVTSSPAAAARVVKNAKNAKPGDEPADPAATPARAVRQRTVAAPRAKAGRAATKRLKAKPKARGAAKPRKVKPAAKPKARAKSRSR